VLKFFCDGAKTATAQGIIGNPELPGHKGRFIVWGRGTGTGGHSETTRTVCTCESRRQAEWICARLNVAEAHAPWTGGRIPF
jgi:hypothetical protein